MTDSLWNCACRSRYNFSLINDHGELREECVQPSHLQAVGRYLCTLGTYIHTYIRYLERRVRCGTLAGARLACVVLSARTGEQRVGREWVGKGPATMADALYRVHDGCQPSLLACAGP